MTAGLSSRRTSEAIAAFVKDHGGGRPRRAVLCTYDFDPIRFEAVLLPEFTRPRRWFRTLVLADAGALQRAAAMGPTGRSAGDASYELAPVRLVGPGVFHPKLVVLQAGDNVLVGVGSSNLTAGGLGGNLELMLFASSASADGRSLARAAIDFLDQLRRSIRLDMPLTAKRFLERVSASLPRGPGPLLHSLVRPLIEQLETPATGKRVSAVLSPWHSAGGSPDGVEAPVLRTISRRFGAMPTVYTDGVKGRGPDLGRTVAVRVLRAHDGEDELDETEDVDEPRPRRPTTLHAKGYLVADADRRGGTLWFGSANCTAPALEHAVTGRGNVELLVPVALDAREVATIVGDLNERFAPAVGALATVKPRPIPHARGAILCGHLNATQDVLEIELCRDAASVRIATSPSGSLLKIAVANRRSSLVGSALARLRDRTGAIPGVLWERLDRGAAPFPISVPMMPFAGSAEDSLTEILDELAGRAPPLQGARSRGPRRGPDLEPDEDPDDLDPELELLTKTEHQGLLDRLAVRVALLSRRLRAQSASAELRAHFCGIVGRLELEPHVREILVEPLRPAKGGV